MSTGRVYTLGSVIAVQQNSLNMGTFVSNAKDEISKTSNSVISLAGDSQQKAALTLNEQKRKEAWKYTV